MGGRVGTLSWEFYVLVGYRFVLYSLNTLMGGVWGVLVLVLGLGKDDRSKIKYMALTLGELRKW
jgi:hypothetical protein